MRGAVANLRERVIHGYPASALEVKKCCLRIINLYIID